MPITAIALITSSAEIRLWPTVIADWSSTDATGSRRSRIERPASTEATMVISRARSRLRTMREATAITR